MTVSGYLDILVDTLLAFHRYVAVEVKSSPRLDNEALRGLRAIRPLPGLTRLLLVYTGPSPLRTEDGIDVWPLDSSKLSPAGPSSDSVAPSPRGRKRGMMGSDSLSSRRGRRPQARGEPAVAEPAPHVGDRPPDRGLLSDQDDPSRARVMAV